MTTFPGRPGAVITEYLTREASRERYEAGTEFQIGQIQMVAKPGPTSTSLPSVPGRFDLSELPLQRVTNFSGACLAAMVRSRLTSSTATTLSAGSCSSRPVGTAPGAPTTTVTRQQAVRSMLPAVDCRAPSETGSAGWRDLSLLRRATEGQGDRHLPGQGLGPAGLG
jgi:hypothetical protein